MNFHSEDVRLTKVSSLSDLELLTVLRQNDRPGREQLCQMEFSLSATYKFCLKSGWVERQTNVTRLHFSRHAGRMGVFWLLNWISMRKSTKVTRTILQDFIFFPPRAY